MKKADLVWLGCTLALLTACSASDQAIPAPKDGWLELPGLDSQVTQLEIRADVGDLSVAAGPDYRLYGENLQPQWLSLECQGGKLTLRYEPPSPESVSAQDVEDHCLNVRLPWDHRLSQLTLSTGTGELSVCGVQAPGWSLSQGTGEAQLTQLSGEVFEVECGAGDLAAQEIAVSRETQLRLGSGELDIQGELTGQIRLEGGVGKTTLRLAGKREAYAIQADGWVRDIFVDGEPFRPVGDAWEWGAGQWDWEGPPKDAAPQGTAGQHSIQIEGGVGEIHLAFAETKE